MDPRVAVKEKIDTRILEEIQIAPEVPAGSKFAAPAASKFGSAQVSKFAAPAASKFESKFGSAQVSKFAAPKVSKFAQAAGKSKFVPTRPGRRIVRKIIHILPPPRTDGRMLWLPNCEFLEAFESGWECDTVWELGDVLNFDDACESRLFQGYPVEEAQMYAITVDNLQETYCDVLDWKRESFMWPEVMGMAMSLREELAFDREQVVQLLNGPDLRYLAKMVGLDHYPSHEEVDNAIATDSLTGLGAAALDYVVWQQPNLLGHTGVQLAQLLKQIEAEEGFRNLPTEGLLFRTGSLHPGTVGDSSTCSAGNSVYSLIGDYVAVKIHYQSDLTGTVIGGWRSVYLEPTGVPRKIDMEEWEC